MSNKQIIFCTREIPAKGIELLIKKLPTNVDIEICAREDGPDHSTLLKKCKNCDGILSMLTDRLDAEFLSQCPKLKIISQMAVGHNNIDIDYCTKHNIAVTNTPDCLTETTAETTLALVLAVSRRIVEAHEYVQNGNWKIPWHPTMLLGQDIHGSVYGIIGLGRIGQRVASIMINLGAEVLYYDTKKLEDIEGAKHSGTLENLIRKSDFISVHCNLTSITHHLIDEEKISWMKPNCIFVNTSRGSIVNQQALIKALRHGQIAGAGLDVYEEEPLPPENPLTKLDNVVLLPHIGSASIQTRNSMAVMAVEGLLSYFCKEKEIKHLVK